MTQRRPTNKCKKFLNRKRTRKYGLASGEGPSSQSPQPKDKKQKRKRTSTAETRKKPSTKEAPTEPTTVVLDEKGTDHEAIPFQRRNTSPPDQPDL